MAGCAAADAASSAGASVVVAEKFASYTVHGIDVGSVGTKVQKERGVEIDRALAARLFYYWGQQQAIYFLIRTYVERSGAVLDRYIDMAPSYGLTVSLNDEMTARADWNNLEDKFKQYQTAHLFERTDKCPFKKSKWNAEYLIGMMVDTAKKNGAQFRFRTKAERLVRRAAPSPASSCATPTGIKSSTPERASSWPLAASPTTRDAALLLPGRAAGRQIRKRPRRRQHGRRAPDGRLAGAAITRCYPAPIIHPINFSVLSPA
jgi:hypothetical protein